MLELDRLREALIGACADAGLDPGALVVFVVGAGRPPGTTPMAYLHPTGLVRPDTVAVFQAVGRERARRGHGDAHRLALWRELPGIPPCALGTMLRHELEHARRWERSGPCFFEADDLLRAAVRGAGEDGYRALPSELEANAASASYASRTLADAQLAELRACAECTALLEPGRPPAEIVEATLSELDRRDDWGPGLDAAGRRSFLAEVRSACAAWDERRARRLARGRDEPELELVAPAEC